MTAHEYNNPFCCAVCQKKWLDSVSELVCPECSEPITLKDQIRCTNCKVLFDWDDEE